MHEDTDFFSLFQLLSEAEGDEEETDQEDPNTEGPVEGEPQEEEDPNQEEPQDEFSDTDGDGTTDETEAGIEEEEQKIPENASSELYNPYAIKRYFEKIVRLEKINLDLLKFIDDNEERVDLDPKNVNNKLSLEQNYIKNELLDSNRKIAYLINDGMINNLSYTRITQIVNFLAKKTDILIKKYDALSNKII